jgi:hypothetical protein
VTGANVLVAIFAERESNAFHYKTKVAAFMTVISSPMVCRRQIGIWRKPPSHRRTDALDEDADAAEEGQQGRKRWRNIASI